MKYEKQQANVFKKRNTSAAFQQASSRYRSAGEGCKDVAAKLLFIPNREAGGYCVYLGEYNIDCDNLLVNAFPFDFNVGVVKAKVNRLF